MRSPPSSNSLRAPVASPAAVSTVQAEAPSGEGAPKLPIPCHVLVVEVRCCFIDISHDINPSNPLQDNLINSRVLTRQLKIAGHEVTAAFDGQQALDLIAKDGTADDGHKPFDVCLMDIEMPVME